MLEENIENKILFWLQTEGVSVDKIISEGYYNEEKQRYQKRKSAYANPGISDIIGSIPPYGRALYIEVKRPDEMAFFDRPLSICQEALIDAQYRKKLKKDSLKRYRHAVDQARFIEEKLKVGAVAFYASSVEEVQKKLKDFGVTIS